jgi:hypothetical protein
MMQPVVPGLNRHRGMGGMPTNLSEFSDRTYQIADSVFDSLVASNDLLPSQWAGALRGRLESKELRLLREVFASAWEDLRFTGRSCLLGSRELFHQSRRTRAAQPAFSLRGIRTRPGRGSVDSPGTNWGARGKQ